MKKFSELSQFFLAVVVIASLCACEVRKKGAKSDTNNGELGRAAVASFFLIEQVAISNSDLQELRSAMSTVMGRGVVMTEDSTFKKWYAPELGCRSYSDDLVEAALVRPLDIGNLSIKDPSGAVVEIAKAPKDFYFAARGLLNSGSAGLSTSGSRGSFAVNHNFTVPGSGSQVEFENVTDGRRERLPAPKVVGRPAAGAPDADNYYVDLDRAAGYRVSYQAPAGAQFVKITLQDNPSNTSQWIVCYGSPDADIMIPQGALSQMRATQEALMTVDFVTVDLRKDFARMKESLVITYSRLYHGRRDLNDLGINDPAFFGRLNLQ